MPNAKTVREFAERGQRAQAAVDELTGPKTDKQYGEEAEREAEAQLAVVRALKPLTQDQRRRVIEALGHIIEAERLVPGIMEQFNRGLGDAPRVE